MDYVFIVNPNAGNGRGLRVWNQTKRLLVKKNLPFEVFFTSGRGDAAAKAKEICRKEERETCIVAVGGDGTLNEVANGMACDDPRVSLAHIPAGSGNDFAKGMNYVRSVKRHLERILDDSWTRSTDYGVMNASDGSVIRRFLISSGCGYDAAVTRRLMDSQLKDNLNRIGLGKLAYVTEGTRQLVACRPTAGYLILDGSRRVEFSHIIFISAHILPYEGGGFRFAPGADHTDGKLEICVFSQANRLKLVPTLLTAKNLDIRNFGGVRFFSCREASIHLDHPVEVHTDGENCRPQTDIDLRCIKQRLRMRG